MTQAESEETTVDTGLDAEQGAEQHEATGDQPVVEGAEQGATQDEDEVVVSIAGESPTPEEEESRAPEWVRELRKSNREKDRKLREQEAEITRLKGSGNQPAAVVVGEEPTLEGCNYDASAFTRDWKAWNQRKQDQETQETQKAADQKKQTEAWQAKLEGYSKAKAALKVKDYEDAEAIVTDTLSVVQQGVIVNGADNPALLVYALGKNPAKAKELAAIHDPVKFAFAVAKLETQLKVTPRKNVPPPERQVRSSVAGAAAVDNQLEKLRAEAAKTGDLSKVIAFNRQKRAAEK